MLIVLILLYLLCAFIFYGYCFSYWTDEYQGVGTHASNVAMSVFFSLIFPLALLPFIMSSAWKYGWRLYK